MLLVKTTIKPSIIAGLGCFADEFIKKDTIIWQFDPMMDKIFTEEQYKALSKREQEYIDTYAFVCEGEYFLCIDNARFMNHSSMFFNTYEHGSEQLTLASRDILPGEELLSNYENFGWDPADKDWNYTRRNYKG